MEVTMPGRTPYLFLSLRALTAPAIAGLLLAVRPAPDSGFPAEVGSSQGDSLIRLARPRPVSPPSAWRTVYREVEQCAGKTGDYEAIRWGAMEGPLQLSGGTIYGFTAGASIVLVRGDTTYLRHEILHHVLEMSGWRPRKLGPGERYTIADLHPMPLFGLCTGGR
jgi:hypothetical protein